MREVRVADSRCIGGDRAVIGERMDSIYEQNTTSSTVSGRTCYYWISGEQVTDVLPDAALHHWDLVAILLLFSLSASATALCRLLSLDSASRRWPASINGRPMMTTLCSGRLVNLVADSADYRRIRKTLPLHYHTRSFMPTCGFKSAKARSYRLSIFSEVNSRSRSLYYLTQLWNTHSYVPSEFGIGITMPLLKDNNLDGSSMDNYNRTITIMCNIFWVLCLLIMLLIWGSSVFNKSKVCITYQ